MTQKYKGMFYQTEHATWKRPPIIFEFYLGFACYQLQRLRRVTFGKPLELIKFSSYLCIRRIKIYRLRFRAIIYDSCTILVHEVFLLHETFPSTSLVHQLGIVNLWIYYKYITSRCSQILLLNTLLSLLGHISDIPVYRFICTLFLKHILIYDLIILITKKKIFSNISNINFFFNLHQNLRIVSFCYPF